MSVDWELRKQVRELSKLVEKLGWLLRSVWYGSRRWWHDFTYRVFCRRLGWHSWRATVSREKLPREFEMFDCCRRCGVRGRKR